MANNKELGLAVVGCGVVGRMRSTLAKDFPGIGWIGLFFVYIEQVAQFKTDVGRGEGPGDWPSPSPRRPTCRDSRTVEPCSRPIL